MFTILLKRLFMRKKFKNDGLAAMVMNQEMRTFKNAKTRFVKQP
ncbi:unknown [Eggerthella sp. CAG:298]|nr:unknown [Eggerthella sp. CAG:298]